MPALSLIDFERDALDTLTTYATIPCLSPDYDHQWSQHGYIELATELLAEWARQRHFANAEVSIHRLDGRTPVLVVTIAATTPGNATAVVYGHLDKQPPLGDWSEGLEPYSPVRRGDRLFARGVADDGYSTFSALLAIENMEANVELMICLDSGALTYDRLWVTTSLRGMLHVALTIKVLTQGQHSGSASGVVPSSFRILRQLLDRVEDADTGDILLDALKCEIPANYVDDAAALAQEFGDVIAHELPTLDGLELMGDSAEDRILRRTWFPTLSIVGMGGIPEPEIAGNVLRPFTTAVLSFRLPPTVDAQRAASAVVLALTTDVPSCAEVTVEVVTADGWMTPPLEPWLRDALDVASREAFGRAPGYTGEGGSIPFLASLAKRYPAVQFVATGVLGPQSNAHAIDEMLDLPMAVGVTNCVSTVLGAFAAQKES